MINGFASLFDKVLNTYLMYSQYFLTFLQSHSFHYGNNTALRNRSNLIAKKCFIQVNQSNFFSVKQSD